MPSFRRGKVLPSGAASLAAQAMLPVDFEEAKQECLRPVLFVQQWMMQMQEYYSVE